MGIKRKSARQDGEEDTECFVHQVMVSLRGARRASATKAVFFCAAIASCAGNAFAADTVRIEGEVYVARADRETVRLSSVTIYFVESSRVLEVMRMAEQLRERKAINDEMRERGMALARVTGPQAATARVTLARFDVLVRSNITVSSQQMEALGISPSSVDVSRTGKLLRAVKWTPKEKVQTDSEGKFAVELPEGEWTVVASAARRVVDKQEDYFWIQPAKRGQRVLLNNNNLVPE